MGKLTEMIKRHQIIAFFILTFAITWGLGFSYSASQVKGIFLLYPVASLATCGPALAGIIITVVISKLPRQGSRRTAWLAFLVAWVVVTLVWLAYLLLNKLAPFSIAVAILSLLITIPVAYVVSMAYSRLPEVKNYLSSLIRLRGVWGWSLLALVFYPALLLLSIPISKLLGRQPIATYQATYLFPEISLSLVSLIVVKFLYQFFFYNAVGEEVGWRGFALPRLQASTSPLIAALIIACFWIPWHFFLWQSQGQPVLTRNFWINTNSYLIILGSIVTGWFYNRSQGSILVAGIVHAAENTTARILLISDWNGYLLLKVIVVLMLILIDHMWKKLPPTHPAMYRELT
ncbi:MAG: CPBP family intramembrane glutamic endopeptidase [Anaerolineales bacterium]